MNTNPIIEVKNQKVTVIGTLVAPGDFRWGQPSQSASPEVHEIVEMLRTSYKPLETDRLHTNQLPTCRKQSA